MPRYDFLCEKHGNFEEIHPMSCPPAWVSCERCGSRANRILFYRGTCAYGTERFHEKAFADASEASGMKITSTKQIDALERKGVMYPITNPSRHRTFKG